MWILSAEEVGRPSEHDTWMEKLTRMTPRTGQLDELIRALPPIDSEEEQIENILSLQVGGAGGAWCPACEPLADPLIGRTDLFFDDRVLHHA